MKTKWISWVAIGASARAGKGEGFELGFDFGELTIKKEK
jgi:hypothetical protein